jgi:hypothetical protein
LLKGQVEELPIQRIKPDFVRVVYRKPEGIEQRPPINQRLQ